MRKRNTKGITLIALVVTIIVLIILAGVSISLVLGDNGIITKAKQGKKEHQEASIIEKVQMALVEYNTDKIVESEEPEVEEALEKLLENRTFDDIDPEYNIGIIDDYEITLDKENQEVIIKEIEKVEAGATRVRVGLKPRGYTNGSVQILVKTMGNIKKITMPDGTPKEAINGKIEAVYTVNKNGTYTFTMEDEEGNTEEKNVEVNKIDTLPPKEFTIKAENLTETGFTIIAQAEDTEANTDSACSGIERYEYYVKSSDVSDEVGYTTYTTNVITGLSTGVYNIYVIAYDRAGNSLTSEKMNVVVGGVVLYNYGDECTDKTGGWNVTGTVQSGGSFEKRTDRLEILGYSAGRIYGGTIRSIDCSKYNKLAVTFKRSVQLVLEDSETSGWGDPTTRSGWRAASGDGDNIVTEIFDISNIDSGWLHFTMGPGGYSEIYSVVMF